MVFSLSFLRRSKSWHTVCEAWLNYPTTISCRLKTFCSPSVSALTWVHSLCYSCSGHRRHLFSYIYIYISHKTPLKISSVLLYQDLVWMPHSTTYATQHHILKAVSKIFTSFLQKTHFPFYVLSLPGTPDVSWPRSQALLCSNQTECHLRLVLWWQLQCHFEEVQKHGGTLVWLPLALRDCGNNKTGLYYVYDCN